MIDPEEIIKKVQADIQHKIETDINYHGYTTTQALRFIFADMAGSVVKHVVEAINSQKDIQND